MMDIIHGKKTVIAFVGICLLVIIILILPANIQPKVFLSKTERVNANLLIVEGWLPSYSVDLVNKEFRDSDYDMIITSGVKSSNLDYCTVGSLGTLIFYPHFDPGSKYKKENHHIEIIAHSGMGGRYKAHFNFCINDSLAADFTAGKQKRKYGLNWYGSLGDIDSLSIEFDNDLVDEHGDRDLFIKEIVIDNEIHIPYQFNSVYEILTVDGKKRILNNVNSNSDIVRNELITSGIDPSLIVSVSADKVIINRTLSSALATRNLLGKMDLRIRGINVMSLGVHSRRTYMTYEKVLGKSYTIGIVSIPQNNKNKSKTGEIFEIIYEIIGIIYYQIIFLSIKG
jgi:hypothetical protein